MVRSGHPDRGAPPDAYEAGIGPDTVAKRAARGALAGIVATLIMSLVMLPAQWVGLLGTQPPRRIADRLIESMEVSRTMSEGQRRWGTTIVHIAIGAVGGALFALGRLATGRRGRAPVVGVGFGASLWGFNYIVAAPRLGLFPPPADDRPGRPPVMLAANSLFGVVTAVLVDRLDPHSRTARG